MNVLKPNERATVKILLERGVSQRAISAKTGIDRKTIRRYSQLEESTPQEERAETKSRTATGIEEKAGQNPPPRPPDSNKKKLPKHARSACDNHRAWIEEQLRLGRNAMSIYQDLVEQFGFAHRYNSVKRFVRGLKQNDPRQYDRLEFLPGEEGQVDYGVGAPTRTDKGNYRRPRLFVMTLKYSGRAFRKSVWKSSKEIWCRLHEEGFRYFGGCPENIVLDNLKEGVIKPDIYDPELNALYAVMLSHYQVVADPARVRDPNRKGTVENGVKYTQDTALKGRKFETLDVQNEWLMHWEERWASQRIHGRSKRQVEMMFQEEKPYLLPLPLASFVYFRQETRTVYDDGTIQVDNCYYAANPAALYSEVLVRIYEQEIEILDPQRMEIIRRHPKGKRPGSLCMDPEERIFNPSRQTDRLLVQAEMIGPNTFSLCEQWFNEEGRCGLRRMYGLLNLVRHYPVHYVEKAAELANVNGLKSSRAIRRMVENMGKEAEEPPSKITQEHPLIRSGEDYGRFWDRHAAGGKGEEVSEKMEYSPSKSNFPEQMSHIWHKANWHKVIEVFALEVDPQRNRRDDEIWIKSPFTKETHASLHLSLTENVFKDFSSGKGGGILHFCREMFRLEGCEKSMTEVAQWMVNEGISSVESNPQRLEKRDKADSRENRAIKIDLRRYLRPDHPQLQRRGISAGTCRYLGCGFLPQRSWAKTTSPLGGRIVFQIRGIQENGNTIQAVILSHSGRSLSREQEESDGKYWSYPFRKSLEIYNQDHILLDEEAMRQANRFGLILTEGFFDVAKLVEAGCRNGTALMGCTISAEQIRRLMWIHSKIRLPRIMLFLDQDPAGLKGAEKILKELSRHEIPVAVLIGIGGCFAMEREANP